MILNDEWFLENAENGIIKPFNPEQVQPNSYDLMLKQAKYDTIKPLEFLLAETKERVEIPPNCVGLVKGKSSIGRLGLCIQNAGLVDSGFRGTITLELFNQSSREINLAQFKEVGIAQLVILECLEPKFLYNGHYQDQSGIRESYLKESLNEKEM